ncbi:MAG: prepilin-type N-terminal cleavage/methylation domain-containing protein [Candidatus Paceibacterota bacterium]|jgi:prepilin-type N-terminal cleavage/methylation domain-containing protein
MSYSYLKSKNNTAKKGFTLVEVMVSVSIFLIVAFVVTSVFITALGAYRKSKQISLLVDNVNYAMERMVLNLREGTGYNITNGGSDIAFMSSEGISMGYKLSGSNKIQECKNSECIDLTEQSIGIEKLSFEQSESDAGLPPVVRINALGKITTSTFSTSINLQTTVAQRNTSQ